MTRTRCRSYSPQDSFRPLSLMFILRSLSLYFHHHDYDSHRKPNFFFVNKLKLMSCKTRLLHTRNKTQRCKVNHCRAWRPPQASHYTTSLLPTTCFLSAARGDKTRGKRAAYRRQPATYLFKTLACYAFPRQRDGTPIVPGDSLIKSPCDERVAEETPSKKKIEK